MARLSAAWSNATFSGERLSDVMSQPSPTSCIQAPKSDANPAIQSVRKTGSRSGAHAEGRGVALGCSPGELGILRRHDGRNGLTAVAAVDRKVRVHRHYPSGGVHFGHPYETRIRE
jgi:hypothetical protein